MSNVAERLIQEGMKKGIKKGIEKTAKEMLKRNLPIAVISECTGLSKEDVEKLKDTGIHEMNKI